VGTASLHQLDAHTVVDTATYRCQPVAYNFWVDDVGCWGGSGSPYWPIGLASSLAQEVINDTRRNIA